jgi:hypothetical protein
VDQCDAAAEGLLSITAINMREAAPFLALIGPEEAVSAGEIDLGFPAYYAELLQHGDLGSALAKLSGKFGLFLADRLLLKAFAGYLREGCKGVGRDARIERLLAEFLEKNAAHKVKEAAVRRFLEDYTRPNPEAFERFKRRFLLSDHPLNKGRFDSLNFDAALAAGDRAE